MPVILIRGMCQALRLDLGFFSTKSLSQVAGDRTLSIFTQSKSERWNLGNKCHHKLWPRAFLDEKMSHENLKEYAEYQSTNFRTALREESKKNAEKRNKVKNTKTPKVPVRLGVFEIRDNQFHPNLAEIQKLPLFMKYYSGRWFAPISSEKIRACLVEPIESSKLFILL